MMYIMIYANEITFYTDKKIGQMNDFFLKKNQNESIFVKMVELFAHLEKIILF